MVRTFWGLNYYKYMYSLAEAIQTLKLGRDLDGVLTSSIEAAVALAGADAGILGLRDRHATQLAARKSYGYRPEALEMRFNPGEGAIGLSYTQRKAIFFTTPAEIESLREGLRPKNRQLYDKSREGLPPAINIVAVPLTLADQAIGALQLEHYRDQGSPTTPDLISLEILARVVASAIQNARLDLELSYVKQTNERLLARFITEQEEERARIARELHDEIGQYLVVIMLKLEKCESTLRACPSVSPDLIEDLRASKSFSQQTLGKVKDLCLNLRPPLLIEAGLCEALDCHIDNLLKQFPPPITLHIKGRSKRLPSHIEIEVFRIIQEALTNVIKHAEASRAEVRLNFLGSKLVIQVEDNGKGFNVAETLSICTGRTPLGLRGMRERLRLCEGTYRIDSAPGQGTRIEIVIPIPEYAGNE